jgi:magnesium-transporting ATPase (P-type)
MLGVAPISTMFGLDWGSPGNMNRKPRNVQEPIVNAKMYVRLFIAGLFMAATPLSLFRIGKTPCASSYTGQTMALVVALSHSRVVLVAVGELQSGNCGQVWLMTGMCVQHLSFLFPSPPVD